MSKVWDKPITADTDWGGDASTDNLPVSGRQVQAWIKGNIKNDDAISLLIAKWLNEHTTNSITFWKGLPIDSGTLKWVDEHLTVIGGTGSSEAPQDLPFIYDPVKKAWEFKGDFVVTGAITMFGSLSGFQPSTVTEAVEVDGETIVKTKNSQGQWQLTAIGRGDGTGGGISASEVNLLIENALKPYALSTSIPTDNKQLSNGAGYATVSDLDTRINNLINGAPAAYDTLKEIADVLAGNINSIGEILTALDTKATKTYVDGELAKYILKDTAQDISVRHNFVDGLQIGGLPITKSASANNTIYLDANLVVSGAITMFGSGSTTFPTIWANIPFNSEHMSWDGSQWNIKGGGGSGSLDTNAVNVLISEYLTRNSYATISDISSALVGYATQSWVGDNYLATANFTKANIKSTLGISDWALAETKPTYTAAEVGALSKYGDTVYGLLTIDRDPSLIKFTKHSALLGYLGFSAKDTPIFWSAENNVISNLLHSGNIGSYNAGSATKLQTPRTIWGKSFDGTGNIDDVLKINGAEILWSDGKTISSVGTTGFTLNLEGSLITANGSVGIGGTTADAKLHVYGDGRFTQSLHTDGNLTAKQNIETNQYIRINAWSGYGSGTCAMWYNGNTSTLEVNSGASFAYDLIVGRNVAVGGTTASAQLHVHGDILADSAITAPKIYAASSTASSLIEIKVNGSTSVATFGYENGYGAIIQSYKGGNYFLLKDDNTAYISCDTTINGNLLTTGAITMFSQASMKNIVNREGLSLEQLSMIEPARFTWKDGRDSLVHAGGIADEVMQVLPEVVYKTSDDKLTMDYGSAGFFMAASLIKPVIDHEKRIEELEREVEYLKNENKQLRAS